MADTVTLIEVVHQRGLPPATVEDLFLVDDPREAVTRASEHLAQIAGGVLGGKVRMTVQSSTAIQATGTLVADVSDATAGDKLYVNVPGYPTITITAVNGSPSYTSGQVDMAASTDSLFGDEFVSVFSQYPPLKALFTASNNAGTVTVTVREAGTWANSITFTESVTGNHPYDPTSPSGGYDHGARATIAIVCGTPDIVEDDTLRFGSVLLTWKASAANENQVTLSTTGSTAATNLGAAINAHSMLKQWFTASVSSATVTVTYNGPPGAGELHRVVGTETNAGSVTVAGNAPATGGAFTSGSTEAYVAATRTYTLGAA